MHQSSSSTERVVKASNDECAEQPDHAMVIVTSASLQTQGMAMVLARAMQEQGVQLSIMLCDKAGDLAVDGYQSLQALAPKGMKPEGLLQKIIDGGADVTVCALYLPNSIYQEQDLRKNVRVAQPADMAQLMRNKHIKVFTF